jgi:myo-inositol-1(or 4)-monophosphatase
LSRWGAQATLPGWLPQLVDELAADLRELVFAHLGRAGARGLAGRAAGGDRTFSIDLLAEERVEAFLAAHGRPLAVYSEDRGLQAFGERAEFVLVVDPIDGTRPAAAGFEAACVSIAVARLPEPSMADVVYGVVHEIKEGGVFRATRGQGVRAEDAAGRPRTLELSRTADLDRLFWTIGFRGRPAAELVAVLGGLIDRSSVDGAVFDIGSATYSMTRILTGQLDAYVDVGPRLIEVAPWVEARFREVGKGGVLNNAPYDVAASTLILEEAGCPVTDTLGRSLAERPLLGSDIRFQMAVVASANEVLQAGILEEVGRGLARLAETGASGAGRDGSSP